MPANINERDGEVAVMVVREPAWHKSGKVLPPRAIAKEAISAAKLDWNIIKQPLFDGTEEHRHVTGHFAVVREGAGN